MDNNKQYEAEKMIYATLASQVPPPDFNLDMPVPFCKSEGIKRASTIKGGVYDAGLHYRKQYKGIKLDPFRIAQVYNSNAVQLTILKKVLATGERGSKDAIQDYKDIINAATRAIEMIEEDGV